MTSEDIGKEFAKNILAAAGSDDPALLGAMASVSRENHLFAPPWWIASESSGWWTSSDIHDLYQDTIVALDKSRGINNVSPLLWARALSAVSIKAGDRIQHVGCGGGYYSAILAELVGPEGTVHAWDVDEAMARPAARALQGYGNVIVGPGNPLTGPVGDYDGIVSSAGLSDIPRSWMLSRPQPKYLVFPLGGIISGGIIPGFVLGFVFGAIISGGFPVFGSVSIVSSPSGFINFFSSKTLLVPTLYSLSSFSSLSVTILSL